MMDTTHRSNALACSLIVMTLLHAPAILLAQGPALLPPDRPLREAAMPLPSVPATIAERDKPSFEAERIARAHRTVEGTRKLVNELAAQIDDPEGEYKKFQESFVGVDDELQQKRKDLAALKEAGNSEAAAALEAELPRVERKWRLIKERFELKIEERRQLVEQLETLKQKLVKDEEALAKLIAGPQTANEPEARPASEGATAASVGQPVTLTTASPATPGSAASAAEGSGAAPQPTPGEGAAASAMPGTVATASSLTLSKNVPAEDAPSQEVQDATALASQKQAAAKSAEDTARSINERIALLQESVKAARALRETTRKQVDNADASVHALEAAVQRRQFEEATPQQLKEVEKRLADARERLRLLRVESRERANALDEMQVQLTELQAEQINAMQDAEQRRKEAEAAQKLLDDLQNPFTPRNLMHWSANHGPPLIAILLSMASLVWLARVMEGRLVNLIANRGGRGAAEERENQAKTLVGVFRNAATMVIISGGILMLLDEVRIPIAPLMGGAAVFGLAVAFGAQSLIKDFFSGFMILLEQQYMVNDVIKIGDISGQVERITLRTTVLRDLEGRVHFIPHGQIGSTTNMTHGWSRAVFDIGVAYKEDVNRVMGVLVELGKQLRRDPEFGPLILEDPVMLGVDGFGDSSVTLKFYLKTRPLRQWPVKRELLRRIKVAFDEMGIEIPYPHRTIFHRAEPVLHNGELQHEWPRQVA